MLLTNTKNSYGLIAKLFHWIISIIVIAMLIAGFLMDDYIEPPLKWQIFGLHEATGVLILTLVILRLLWKFYNPNVLLPADLPNWQKKAATININLLYLLMILMPISGFFMTILSNHHIDFTACLLYNLLPKIYNSPKSAKNPPKSSFIIYCSDYSSYTSCVLSSFY